MFSGNPQSHKLNSSFLSAVSASTSRRASTSSEGSGIFIDEADYGPETMSSHSSKKRKHQEVKSQQAARLSGLLANRPSPQKMKQGNVIGNNPNVGSQSATAKVSECIV
jgi:hypothetical protein